LAGAACAAKSANADAETSALHFIVFLLNVRAAEKSVAETYGEESRAGSTRRRARVES
jgi:hypothetical protein